MAKAKGDRASVAAKRLDAAWQWDRQNREEAQQDLKFLSGDQWPTNIRREREVNNRPVLTVNQLPQFVRQVVNDMRQNPRDIKFIPADGAASDEMAEIYTGLIRHIQNQSKAPSVYAHAGEHAVACGIGHFRVITDYIGDNAFEQEIQIKRIHYPLSVYWAPGAMEPDRSDAEYCFVTEQIPTAEFKERYPKASPSDVQVSVDAGSHEGLFWRTRDYVLVAEYWYKEPCVRTIGRNQEGQISDLTDVDPKEYEGLGVVKTKKVHSHKVMRELINGDTVLEGPAEWPGQYIPIFPVIGSEVPIETFVYRYGLVRFARDSQALYNFWRSAAAESIALAPKSPYLATPAMLAKFKAQWDTMNTKARNYLLYEPDPMAPGAKPEREPPADVPMALVTESNMASADLKSTIGIYEPQLGMKSNEVSGRAIMARDRQGDVGTFHFSDNLTITLNHLGNVMADLIPRIYDSERIIRILTPKDKQEFVEINKTVLGEDGEPVVIHDMTVGKYSVKVKVGPSHETARAEAAEGMMQFVQACPGGRRRVIGDILAKTQDWPEADEISARLKVLLPPQVQGLQIGPDGNPLPAPL